MVPFGLVPGPAVVRLTGPNGVNVPPVLLQIDPIAPGIVSAVTGFGTPIDSLHPAQTGDTITLVAGGLVDSLGNLPSISSIAVNFGGVDQPALSLTQVGSQSVVQAIVPQNLASGSAQVTLRVDTRISSPYTIYIR
jgi:uncharacterized protein (TIGR03437 family)